MSKDAKVLDDMVDYVHQLRRHTKGRRALHIRMSALEKHLRDEHSRRFAASTLRPLITDYGANMFALPNTDLIVIAKDASVDVMDTMLNLIRRKMKDAAIVSSLDPIQGVSDAFTEWFDLEANYDSFNGYTQNLAEDIRQGVEKTPIVSSGVELQPIKMKHVDEPLPPPQRKIKMRAITAPDKNVKTQEYDPELLLTLTRALSAADIGGLLHQQCVMAIIGTSPPQPVVIHKSVPDHIVIDSLLESKVVGSNTWLKGYLDDFLADRLMAAQPSMKEENSLAASVRVTSAAIFGSSFADFDNALSGHSKSKVILEFSVVDLLSNFAVYQEVLERLGPAGYGITVADIDLRALLWLDHTHFQASFIKVSVPAESEDEWVTKNLEEALRAKVQQIGVARVILAGCENGDDIALGQRLGITLFQGEAVDPLRKI